MRHLNIPYKGYTISQRIDVKSHCATIYKGGEIVKMVSGSIELNGTTNVIEKSKKVIDTL
jgi:hypothetical protein